MSGHMAVGRVTVLLDLNVEDRVQLWHENQQV
jgi:hypothetical protein